MFSFRELEKPSKKITIVHIQQIQNICIILYNVGLT